jgi:hypothetical protein
MSVLEGFMSFQCNHSIWRLYFVLSAIAVVTLILKIGYDDTKVKVFNDIYKISRYLRKIIVIAGDFGPLKGAALAAILVLQITLHVFAHVLVTFINIALVITNGDMTIPITVNEFVPINNTHYLIWLPMIAAETVGYAGLIMVGSIPALQLDVLGLWNLTIMNIFEHVNRTTPKPFFYLTLAIFSNMTYEILNDTCVYSEISFPHCPLPHNYTSIIPM